MTRITCSDSPNLCMLHTQSGEELPKTVCQLSNEQAIASVLLIIGSLFLVTSLYILLAGTGTIPALTSGWGLLAAGGGCLIGGIIRLVNSFYKAKN